MKRYWRWIMAAAIVAMPLGLALAVAPRGDGRTDRAVRPTAAPLNAEQVERAIQMAGLRYWRGDSDGPRRLGQWAPYRRLDRARVRLYRFGGRRGIRRSAYTHRYRRSDNGKLQYWRGRRSR